MKIYLNGIATWEVPKYTYSDPHMGVRSVSLTLEHPSNCLDESIDVPDFKDATVEYNGESFYISSANPTGEKSTGSLNYKYTLVFNGAEDRLNSLIIRDLAEVSVNRFVSQGASFSISADLKVFSKLIENNLKYYIGDEWSVILNEDPLIESTESRIDVKSITAFELLQKAYELYNVRWKISGTTVTIGYTPDSALHVFDYGKDGGLAKISRTVSDVGVYNRVIGSGGTRNIPMNYFTNRYSNFPADPNPVSDVANIKNLMPKAFRDSVIAESLPYKDYAENAESIAEIGLREIAVEPNEKIYPSITGVTEEGIGRIDKIIAYEDIDEQTFNIWVKDIGFDLSHDDYTLTEEAKISFTSGNTTGYEYTILARDDKRVVVEDTSKSHDGVSSKYKITLIKSNEDEDIGRDFIPNEHLFPSPDDTFIIYNIALPHYYVLKAEERLQAWLEEQLYDLIVDKPSYLIEPYDGFFNLNPDALNKLESGNKVSVINDILAPTPIHLHISNITIKYGDSVVPKYSIVVSDKVEVNGSTVDRLSSRLDSVENRQYFSVDEIKDIISNLNIDRKYISKMHNDTAQGFIEFLKGISVEGLATFLDGLTSEGLATFLNGISVEGLATFLNGISVKELAILTQGLEIGDYTTGLLGGGGAFKMKDGISELEVDKLTVRMVATFFEIVVSKLRHINGGLVLSRGAMTCSRVEEDADSYQCFFERGDNNEISNTFVVNDQARCQVFNGGNQKFYWRLVTEVGDDWIRLSKTVGIGDSIPTAGDDIVQLGYQGKDLEHVKRLNAQIIDESGISQYVEIDSFTLEGKRRNFISADGTGSQFTGKVSFKNAGKDYDLSDWAHETETAIQEAETAIQEAVEKIAPPVWAVQAVNIIPNAPTAIFRRGSDEALHQLTLVPKFTRDGVDVTDIMNQSGLRLYEFERRNMWGEDDNGYLDSAWNLANKGRTQVTLTHEDIVFIGNINMRFNDELLETEYQKLK